MRWKACVIVILFGDQTAYPFCLGKNDWLESSGVMDYISNQSVPSYDGSKIFDQPGLEKRGLHFVAGEKEKTVTKLAEDMVRLATVVIFYHNLVRTVSGTWAG